VVELKLRGVWILWIFRPAETMVTNFPDYFTGEIPPPIHLPSLPALTTLVIDLSEYEPSPHLTNILCSIGSAPALTSRYSILHWRSIKHSPLEDPWVDVDRWLSRIAQRAKVKGGLALTLTQWPEGKSVWEGFLPEFRESGGEIKVDHESVVAMPMIENLEIFPLKGLECFTHFIPSTF
jgi:hypothetical protein